LDAGTERGAQVSGDREAVLGRIREALREPAPHPPAAAEEGGSFREWLPPVEPMLKDRIAHFARMSEMLRTEFVECRAIEEAAQHLANLATAGDWRRLAFDPGELCAAVATHLPLALERMPITAGYDRAALERCDAGLTECECLVAQTGSVCVTTLSSGGRTLSVLPPHHVVIARREQVVTDLTAAYALLAEKYRGAYPSFMSFITGPSRTGDIERILVLGAHGPKRLTILLVP
jgi:L-lactate dehydrogenase complex protein LldG